MPPYAAESEYEIISNYPQIDYKYVDRQLSKHNTPLKLDKNTTASSYKGTFNQRFLAKKITKDGLYYIFDSSKKPTFDEDYAKSSVKEYTSGIVMRNIFKIATKIGGGAAAAYTKTAKTVSDASICILSEENYLRDQNMFDMENLGKAHIKCVVNSGVKRFNYELGLIGNVIGIGSSTLTDIAIENSYSVHQRGHFGNVMNHIILTSYDDALKPILEGVDVISGPLNSTLDFIGDSAFKAGNYLVEKTKTFFGNESTPHLPINSYENVIGDIFTPSLNLTYDSFYEKYKIDNYLGDKYEDNYFDTTQSPSSCDNLYNTTFEDNICEGPSIDDEFVQGSFINDTIDNITNDLNVTDKPSLKEQLQIFSDKLMPELGKMSQFISVCNLIKNFKNMTDISKITEIECFLIGLQTDDKLVNGLFRFVADIAQEGNIKLNNVLNLTVSVAEKYLQVPMKNAYNFVKALVDGDSVKKYVMPVLMDIASLIVPSMGLVNMLTGIVKGIESLFSHQSIKKFDGIDAVCTDQFKIGFFKIRHKITFENAFFGIKVTHTSRHAKDGKEYCEREFKKQLDHKVYQVLGIPVEFVNDTYIKPTTRFGNYALKFYLEDLERKWLDINDKNLSDKDRRLIESMYFESQEDKNYRYELAKKGEAPSWYWHNKRNNIITFIKDIWCVISKDFDEVVNINELNLWSISDLNKLFDRVCKFVSTTYHHIFDNNMITPVDDLEKKEGDERNDSFENARDKRNNNDNNKLDNYRDSQREYYNNLVGPYSREEIIRRACMELWERQQTLEYILNSGYSTFIGFMGSSAAYIDYEVQKFIRNPLVYPFGKLRDYVYSFTQGYITGIFVDQACLWTSLIEMTENLSDDFLINYINPFIASGVGLGVGIMRYLATYDKTIEKNKFKYVMYNGVTSTVNSSFGVIFSYLKKTATFSSLKTTMWSDFTIVATKALNAIFKIGMTVDFVSAVAAATAFNLGMRILSKLYNLYTNIPEYIPLEEPRGDNEIVTDIYRLQIEYPEIVSEDSKLQKEISNYQEDIKPDIDILQVPPTKPKTKKFKMKETKLKKYKLSNTLKRNSLTRDKFSRY